MKSKAILVSFIAFLAIVFALNTVIASTTTDFVKIEDVIVNDISIKQYTSVGKVSDVVPVEIKFTANKNVSERVKLRVYIEGYKNEISDSVVLRTPLEDGVTYIERFSLRLPSTMDFEDHETSEDLSLLVRFSAKGEDSVEEDYPIKMQKDLYSLNLLSIEATDVTVVGNILGVDIVIQNNGYDRLDNVYLRVSIPDLGLEKRVYVGDLESDVDDFYDEIRDAINKKVYMTIPRDTMPGVYNVEVEAYNYDTSVTAERNVAIEGFRTGVLPATTSKAISIGEETTFDVILVNPNNNMVVYSVTPGESKGLIVEVTEPIVTVPADSSRTVKVKVRAADSAEEGTHLVNVNVNSESGPVKQVTFTVNVEGKANGLRADNFVLVLTVILVIIFVVLLIVLIVLLTRRPEEESEEFGETSYY